MSVTQQLLDDQPNKRSSSKEKPIQFKMCCCGCIKDICDCACGLLTWVISTIVSVIVLGGIISLILWLVGVFDGEETTTVSPATVAAAEGVVRSFAGTNPSIQMIKPPILHILNILPFLNRIPPGYGCPRKSLINNIKMVNNKFKIN